MWTATLLASLLLFQVPAPEGPPSPVPAPPTPGEPAPLVLGETFTLDSKVLGETRRINVYRPPGTALDAHLPVLYMPDGGMGEDFLHVAGLVQISVANGTMRPFLLVGIENTERRRDLAGFTDDPEDLKIAPKAGGAERFRRFLRTELKPAIALRYAVTEETAIVGESLAGLFVVETLLLEPDLFDIYIAIDPSLWWNRGKLVAEAGRRVQAVGPKKALYLASSDQKDIATATARLAETLAASRPGLLRHYAPMPRETHRTIFHPAALAAFRAMLAPAAGGGK